MPGQAGASRPQLPSGRHQPRDAVAGTDNVDTGAMPGRQASGVEARCRPTRWGADEPPVIPQRVRAPPIRRSPAPPPHVRRAQQAQRSRHHPSPPRLRPRTPGSDATQFESASLSRPSPHRRTTLYVRLGSDHLESDIERPTSCHAAQGGHRVMTNDTQVWTIRANSHE